MSDAVFHCDLETREALLASRPRTILFGGYRGYGNFGDVLQLMGTLRWHRDQGEVDPVVVCDAASIPDAGFVARVRERLRPARVLFYAEAPVDLHPVGLEELRDPPAIPVLHVYGGGFLNGMWGWETLRCIEAIHERFGVARYVLSGQQVGPELSDTLERHFSRLRPFLVGARDERSVHLLRRCGADAFVSFDDSLEAMAAVAQRLGVPTPRTPGSAAIHLNLSPYNGEGDPASRRYALGQSLAGLRAWLEARADAPRVTLLRAYEDRRPEILDTLSVVKELEDEFPFPDVRVLDLVSLAFDPWGVSATCTAALDAEIAVSASHHVTLLCTLLGVPCFLLADNAFYRQKRAGLGIPHESFEAFLVDPVSPSLDRSRAHRASWCERLAEAIRSAPEPRATRSPRAASGASPWLPKPGAADTRSRLESERDEARREANAWRREAEDLRSWLAEREETIAWFRAQAESWRKIAEERCATAGSLRPSAPPSPGETPEQAGDD